MTYANELKIGTRIEIEARGEFSTTGTPTIQIGSIYGATAGAAGGTALAQSGVITTGSGAAAWPWHYNISGVITAVGTSGVIYCQGILDLGTSLTAVASSWCPVTAAARSVTIDTTTAKSWGLGCAFGTSNVRQPDHRRHVHRSHPQPGEDLTLLTPTSTSAPSSPLLRVAVVPPLSTLGIRCARGL
jgi:hypothetical protein